MESSEALTKLELSPAVAAAAAAAGGGSIKSPGPQAAGPQERAHLNGCVPLSHQVAGHKYGVDKVGILQHPDGTVLKQVQPPPRGPRELQFYSMVFADECSDPCLLELQDHLPKYYGTWSSPDKPNDLYLKLEDVTSHFIRPCIMDVKLGQKSYDPFASQEKREQQIRKYPLMEEIGFLILGMRVYSVCRDSFDSYNQHYGRSLVKDNVKDGLAKFFHNGACLRKDAIRACISRVQKILHWFSSQQQLAFYASSLLFVYEGLPSSLSPPSLLSFLVSPTVNESMMQTAKLDVKAEDGEGQKKEMTENNNNTEVSWNHSLAAIYSNHRKDVDHLCGRAFLHNDATQVTTASDSVDRRSENTHRQKAEPKHTANGNENKSSAWGRSDGEEEEGRRKEEEEAGGLTEAGHKGEHGVKGEVEVKMIDFAHVFPSDGLDHGYIFGLKNLLTVLEQILCDAALSFATS